MKRGDTPGGGNDESDFSDSGEIEQAKTIPGEDSEDPGEVSSSAVHAVTLSVNFLCRTYLRAPFVLRDPETLRKWREMVTGLVTGSFGARVWLLTWLQRNNALLEIFLGRSLSAEARDTFAVIASAAVRGPTPAIDKHGSGGNGSTLTCVSSVNEISALVDSVVRDVARGASAANEETQLEHGAVVSWYFVVLNAFVCGDDGGKDKERTYKRVCRLSRLDILEPLLECACLLGSKAGRRREVYNRRRLHDDGTLDDRGKECMSAVWNLCCLVLRAADTTQARRVFASRCAPRVSQIPPTDSSPSLNTLIKRKYTSYITSRLFAHTVRLKTDPVRVPMQVRATSRRFARVRVRRTRRFGGGRGGRVFRVGLGVRRHGSQRGRDGRRTCANRTGAPVAIRFRVQHGHWRETHW